MQKEEEHKMSESFPTCRVCNGPGKGFHYGVITCDACKGFFHRSLRNNVKYKCAKDCSCLLRHGKGIMCRLCRLKKCLAVGMASDVPRYARFTYTSRKKTEVTNEEKKMRSTSILSKLNSQGKEENTPKSLPSFTSNCDEANTSLRSSQLDELHPKQGRNTNTELSSMSTSLSIQEKYINCSTMTLSPAAEPPDYSFLGHKEDSKDPAFSPSSESNLPVSERFQMNFSSMDSPCSQSLPTSLNEKLLAHHLYNRPTSNVTKQYITELYADRDAVLKTLLEANVSAFSYIYDNWSLDTLEEDSRKHFEMCKARSELFGPLRQLSDDEYGSLYMQTGLDGDERQETVLKFCDDSEKYIRHMIQFIQNVPGFKSLTMEDKMKLIKCGRFEFALIMIYPYCNTELGVLRVSSDVLICSRDAKKFVKANKIDMFVDHIEGSRRLQALNLCFEERVVLLAMSILAPDRSSLTRTSYEIVFEIYWNLAKILLHLLGERCDNPNRVFAELVGFSTWFRQSELHITSWMKKTFLHPYSLKGSPLTKDIIRDDDFHDLGSSD